LLVDWRSSIIEEGAASGEVAAEIDARMLRDVVFGGIEHIAWRSLTAGDPIDVPNTSRRLTRLFLAGIAASRT